MIPGTDLIERALSGLNATEREAVRWVVDELRRFLHPVAPHAWTEAHLLQFERERLRVMPPAAQTPFRTGLRALREAMDPSRTRPPQAGHRTHAGFDRRQNTDLFAVSGSGSTQEIRLRPPRPNDTSLPGVDLATTHLGRRRETPDDS